MLTHFGILSSSVASLAGLGIYTSDGQWQGDVRKGMPSEPVRRKHFLMVLTMESRERPNAQHQAEHPKLRYVVPFSAHIIQHSWAFPTTLEEIRCRPHWRVLRNVFMERF